MPSIEKITMRDILSNKDNYILGYFKSELIGIVFFYKFNLISYITHIAIKKVYRGQLSEKIANASIDWMSKNTDCKKLIAIFPSINFLAGVIARRCGFIYEGTIKKSFQRNGKIYDQHIFGKEV